MTLHDTYIIDGIRTRSAATAAHWPACAPMTSARSR